MESAANQLGGVLRIEFKIFKKKWPSAHYKMQRVEYAFFSIVNKATIKASSAYSNKGSNCAKYHLALPCLQMSYYWKARHKRIDKMY